MTDYATKQDLLDLGARIDAKFEKFASDIAEMFSALIKHMDERFDRIEARLDRHDRMFQHIYRDHELSSKRLDGHDAQIKRLNKLLSVKD